MEDYFTYQQAMKLIKQNSFEQAEPLLKGLVEKYPDSYKILGAYGKCLISDGKLAEGAENMRRAREICPVLMKDPGYLTEYGRVLYLLGEYEKSDKYFEECKKLISNPEQVKEYEQYIEKIHQQKNN